MTISVGVKQTVGVSFSLASMVLQFMSILILAHINNLYNTTFWALVHGGLTTTEANKTLQVSFSKYDHQMCCELPYLIR